MARKAHLSIRTSAEVKQRWVALCEADSLDYSVALRQIVETILRSGRSVSECVVALKARSAPVVRE